MSSRGFQRQWRFQQKLKSVAVVKYHLPYLKVRQNEVVKFGKSACTSLVRSETPNLHAGTTRTKKSSLKVKKNTFSFKFLGTSTDRYLALWGLVCFRFDRRDVVNTRSVCGHLCHHQWQSASGFVGNVVFSYKHCGIFGL